MTRKTVPDLIELFKQAAEIAAQVPEAMRETAFNRALDLLTNVEQMDEARSASANAKSAKTVAKKLNPLPSERGAGTAGSASALLTEINSTDHPGVITASKVLDKALMVLQIARQNHGVDGLSPAAISRILTEKFRVKTTDASVRMALGAATNLVNRLPEGKGFLYQIMAPGEAYLTHLGNTPSTQAASPRRATGKKRRPLVDTRVDKAAAVPGELKKGAVSKSSSKKSAVAKAGKKIGIKSELLELVRTGFFGDPRTPAQIQDYLRRRRGHAFGTSQIALALLRLVRDGKLERDENKDGQYEYRAG